MMGDGMAPPDARKASKYHYFCVELERLRQEFPESVRQGEEEEEEEDRPPPAKKGKKEETEPILDKLKRALGKKDEPIPSTSGAAQEVPVPEEEEEEEEKKEEEKEEEKKEEEKEEEKKEEEKEEEEVFL